jgi:hypothetical protein
MFTLVAIAAIAAMAFVGASSALAGATDLCKSDPKNGTCPAGTSYALVKNGIHFVDPLALLFATLLGVKKDILCEALFLGEALDLAAAGTGGQIIHGKFTYGEPHGGGATVKGKCFEMEAKENCGEIKEITAGGLLSVLRTGSETGTVTGTGFEVLVECGGLHCIYEAKGLTGTATGPLLETPEGKGNVSITNQSVTKVSGFLCPSSASLTTKQVPLEKVYLGV